MTAEEGKETLAWLALARTRGLGPVAQQRLLQRFGSAVAALAASADEWAEGIGRRGIARPGAAEYQWAQQQWWRVRALGGNALGLDDADYPDTLRHIHDPPPVLFTLGQVEWRRPAIGIVGTRRASPYGQQVARELAFSLSRAGVCVVSGMALGIDAAAHAGALAAGGDTVAVLGCGVDQIYPRSHAALYRRIVETGAVVSEQPMGATPDRGSFPRRNRIISGLSRGVIVVEAAQRSGALITARCANEQGREVFAVPGDIRRGGSSGCHALIKDGAKLVENVEDILEELTPWLHERLAPSAASPSGIAGQVYQLLGREPLHVDELARSSSMAAAQMLGTLLQLELEGLADQYPGKRFARRA
jgi:DNA processing protein